MAVNKPLNPEPERLLASLSPETMDRLADLVVAKLKALGLYPLTSKYRSTIAVDINQR